MEVHQLEYMIAVAEERSFSRAAERLHVSQPSLSQQVKKLENELGTTLFDRLSRGVLVTEAGERLVARARRVLAELVDARRDVEEARDRVSGSLSVGAIPTMAPFLLPDLLRRFVDQWPDVNLNVVENVTERLLAGVVDGDIDLAITSSIQDRRAVHVERLATEPLWVLVPRDNPLSGRKRVSWSAFAKERALVLHEDHCLAGQVTHLCHRSEVQPTVVSRGAQLGTIARMVSAGLGISVVPEMMRAGDRSKSRVYVPFAGEPPTRDICVVWGLLRYRTNAARAIEQLLRRRFS